MYNKIFISYAIEDLQYAESLYIFLIEKGFEPWMDKKDLLPGQVWDYQIQQALRNADFIIILLSSISVCKRGYVQKEFNQAVIYCDEKLDSDIYLIPVKIDDCVVPPKLSKFQWLEYYSSDSLERILQSINMQRSKAITEEEFKRYKLLGFNTKEISDKGEYGIQHPKQLYEVAYSIFIDESNESLKELNIIIKDHVVGRLISARDNYYTYLTNWIEQQGDDFSRSDSSQYLKIEFSFLNQGFVSYTSFTSLYFSGAAHGIYGTAGHNYYINPLRSFYIEELITDFPNFLIVIRENIYEKLLQKAKIDHDIDDPANFFLNEPALEAKKETFDNFYFKKDAIIFVFNPYEISAYAFGSHEIDISFKELGQLFPKEDKLLSFISNLNN